MIKDKKRRYKISEQLCTSAEFLHRECNKYKQFQIRIKQVFASLHRQSKCTLLVSTETNISSSNIGRYIAKWEKTKHSKIIRKGISQISNHRIGFYLINPELLLVIVELLNTDKL